MHGCCPPASITQKRPNHRLVSVHGEPKFIEGPRRLCLVVPNLKTPILNCFYPLLWFYALTDSDFSCLAMLAKPYPVSGPALMPQISNQLHFVQKSAHEGLGTILGT